MEIVPFFALGSISTLIVCLAFANAKPLWWGVIKSACIGLCFISILIGVSFIVGLGIGDLWLFSPWDVTWIHWLIPVSVILVSVALLYSCRVYLRRPALRKAQGRCVECGYDLRASSGNCPECGAPRAVQSNSH